MKRALQAYKRYYQQLRDNSLSWRDFKSLAEKLRREAETTFGEEEALPWPVDEVFGTFINNISKQREEKSLAWIESIENDVLNIGKMSVAEANRLHSKASNPPAILTDEHAIRLSMVVNSIEARLESLALEWLIEKFKELPEASQKKFLETISKDVSVP